MTFGRYHFCFFLSPCFSAAEPLLTFLLSGATCGKHRIGRSGFFETSWDMVGDLLRSWFSVSFTSPALVRYVGGRLPGRLRDENGIYFATLILSLAVSFALHSYPDHLRIGL